MLLNSWHLQGQKYDADSEMGLHSSGVVPGCHEGVEKRPAMFYFLCYPLPSLALLWRSHPNGRYWTRSCSVLQACLLESR
jgi:hypothetical protein